MNSERTTFRVTRSFGLCDAFQKLSKLLINGVTVHLGTGAALSDCGKTGVIGLQRAFFELRPSKSGDIRLSSRYRFEPDLPDVLQMRVNLLNQAASYKTRIAVVSAPNALVEIP